tara:strand:- start:818 stop:1099 length:282 start_codon:yes stop_codon:yes gene_type:complete
LQPVSSAAIQSYDSGLQKHSRDESSCLAASNSFERFFSTFNMMLLLYLVFLSLANLAFSTCVSCGIDFVNRGFYFIGSTKSTDFTFLSQFEGL